MSKGEPKIIREAAGWRRPRWISVDLEQTYFRLEAMTGDECRTHCLTVLRGCMTGEREAGGVADRYLQDCQEHYRRRAQAGQKGGLTKAKNARTSKNPTVKQGPSNARAMLDTPNTIHHTPTETETYTGNTWFFPRAGAKTHAKGEDAETAEGLDGASSTVEEAMGDGDGKAESKAQPSPSGGEGRPYDWVKRIRLSSADTVVPYMSEFCGPDDANTFRQALYKRLTALGVVRFKDECVSFVASVENGNEPKSRAAVLLARLKKAGGELP